jgi:hypothetical protein
MMILGFTESASWPDLLLIYATPRPPSGGLFCQCSASEKNKKMASIAAVPKISGANGVSNIALTRHKSNFEPCL